MVVFATDQFEVPLPAEHRFPMRKYRLLREQLEAFPEIEIRAAELADNSLLLGAHDSDYLARVLQGRLEKAEIRRLGLPWSEALVERSRASVGATLAACRQALDDGRSASLAGGTHHAFRDRCEGFCVFNDAAVSLTRLLQEKCLKKALIVDLDVHQGNGNVAFFRGDSRIFTLSMHGRKNFPFHKETSDLDVELEDGTDDSTYLGLLESALSQVHGRSWDLVLYLAGADPWVGDRLGRLGITARGLLARDWLVLAWCASQSLPVAVTMAGGYAHVAEHTARLQARTVLLFAGLTHNQIEAALPGPELGEDLAFQSE